MNQFENIYGPPYRYSEYAIGDIVTFTDNGKHLQGTILHTCAPSSLAGGAMPIVYIVAVKDTPFVIFASQLSERDSEEPTMTQCPYCRGMHYSSDIARCPLNPNRNR